MAVDLGRGETSPFILMIVQCTCICSIKMAALLLKYPITCIASITFTFVSGFAWHVMKKRVAFSARSSTLYSFLFEDIFKCLLPRDRKLVAQTVQPGERETFAVKPHYRPRLSRLWWTDPPWSELAINARSLCRPQINYECWKSSCENMKIENLCATLVMPHLSFVAPKTLIDGVAVIHMERRVG